MTVENILTIGKMSESLHQPASKRAKWSGDSLGLGNEGSFEALGQPRSKTGLSCRMHHISTSDMNNHRSPLSLQETCRNVIVANLEKYPPESVATFLDEQEWNLIVELRHSKTKPKSGQGGLDGTGRVAPAIPDKYLHAVEQCHLDERVRESETADVLVWKDCVNYSFRSGGLTRPRCLEFPWPILVERIQAAAATVVGDAEDAEKEASLALLEKAPMNISLMVATGVGKAIKKAVKKHAAAGISLTERMEALLQSWKDLAQREGVQLHDTAVKKTPPTACQGSTPPPPEDDKKDWELAEACHTWRQLFAALKQREEARRSKQGQRMRQIRKNLNTDRPKVVKVRLANANKAQRIFNPLSAGSPANSKLDQLKKEATVVSCRQNRGDKGNAEALARMSKAKSGSTMFAMAVAGAAGAKKGGKRRINGQAVMTMPSQARTGNTALRGKFRK